MPLSPNSPDERLAELLVQGGWKLEPGDEYRATLRLAKGKGVNHALHAVLSVLTFGLWMIVWLLIFLADLEKNQVTRVALVVDEAGGISRKPVTKPAGRPVKQTANRARKGNPVQRKPSTKTKRETERERWKQIQRDGEEATAAAMYDDDF